MVRRVLSPVLISSLSLAACAHSDAERTAKNDPPILTVAGPCEVGRTVFAENPSKDEDRSVRYRVTILQQSYTRTKEVRVNAGEKVKIGCNRVASRSAGLGPTTNVRFILIDWESI